MDNESLQPPGATSSQPEPEPQTSIARVSLAAKDSSKDILDGLVHDLNNVILVFISAAYYFDCFSLLLFLRFLGQIQSTSSGILTSGIICILTHTFGSPSQPPPHGFWNHGGALVDFVGEKPASRFKLIVFDVLILGLQILYLALHYKKASLDSAGAPKTAVAEQDLDAEEAGISRANPPAQAETEDGGIELQSLLPPGHESTEREDETPQPQLATTIVLGKKDFKEVFLGTGRNIQAEESATTFRRFLERVNEIQARRAAQAARD
ncbi:hypothetical protein H2198_009912 [Neophaeococcomyces mojaviensis]|uniref:Uncharacterized protein n=1 Tax=Neophaeococcomyces mojaviensis TaxID=3383035 RepID=A0ACC2ZTE0_9EURO|nr:hypothetical protein H2198_009912 [Knufia sp. JES_112]